ncbi:MAG: DNA-directed RNA polymerase subunit P [Candidatus Aenigmarchaeota archaeon]|nr:DNA-directed RNA polymerase subunit P [Candidatus Aenigmarchaeota archaeon]
MYRCLKCRKTFELEDRIRCPYCGYRIIVKARPPVLKRVVAK